MIQLDPDRSLALAYVPADIRPALETLWRLDASLGSVLATGKEPMISRIRLAWWRESLERLDREKAPAEPMLQAAAHELLPRGVSGSELAEMEAGWTILLTPEPLTDEELREYASSRGSRLFQLSARLLGEATEIVEDGGAAWALADLGRHSALAADAESAMALARTLATDQTWAARLRPLGMLAALAARDSARGAQKIEPQGAPMRMLRMFRHRVTGR
jgi:15-cis-phytoene synthase